MAKLRSRSRRFASALINGIALAAVMLASRCGGSPVTAAKEPETVHVMPASGGSVVSAMSALAPPEALPPMDRLTGEWVRSLVGFPDELIATDKADPKRPDDTKKIDCLRFPLGSRETPAVAQRTFYVSEEPLTNRTARPWMILYVTVCEGPYEEPGPAVTSAALDAGIIKPGETIPLGSYATFELPGSRTGYAWHTGLGAVLMAELPSPRRRFFVQVLRGAPSDYDEHRPSILAWLKQPIPQGAPAYMTDIAKKIDARLFGPAPP